MLFTSLDLLVIVFMGLAAAVLLSLVLMFALKNKTAQKVFFGIVSVLGLFTAWLGFAIGASGWFPEQIGGSVLVSLMVVGAFIMERLSKGNEKKFLWARLIAAAALAIGFFNAIM